MARPGQRRLTVLDPGRYEPVLCTRLLAADPDDVGVGSLLFDVLMTTDAAPLWRAAGARLAGCGQREQLLKWMVQALEEEVPVWRLQPLCGDPTIASVVAMDLEDAHPRRRTAAIKALAPYVGEPEVRGWVLARLGDAHAHVRSTAIEALRGVVGEPAVRDALLALLASEQRLGDCVDRALRRGLRAASGDRVVQAALLDGLKGPRAWTSAGALAGAPASDALVDGLLAALREARHSIDAIAPAFAGVARVERVTEAFLPLMRDESALQAALRIVGLGGSVAARDATLAALTHSKSHIRWTALQQLGGRLADPVVRAAVFGCLRDADDSVRMIAVQTLAGRAEDADVIAAARRMTTDGSEAVAVAAAGLVTRTQADPAAWQVLAPCVTQGRMEVYTEGWQRVDPLAQVGALVRLDEVRDAVASLLTAYRAETRAAAARVLAGAAPCEAIADRLSACVEEDEPRVAGEAYAALDAWVR